MVAEDGYWQGSVMVCELPPRFGDGTAYSSWRNKVEMWQLVTAVPRKEQAILVVESLEGNAKADRAVSVLRTNFLHHENGMERLLTHMDAVFETEKVDEAYAAYTDFSSFLRKEDKSGNPTRCWICDSTMHLAHVCPHGDGLHCVEDAVKNVPAEIDQGEGIEMTLATDLSYSSMSVVECSCSPISKTACTEAVCSEILGQEGTVVAVQHDTHIVKAHVCQEQLAIKKVLDQSGQHRPTSCTEDNCKDSSKIANPTSQAHIPDDCCDVKTKETQVDFDAENDLTFLQEIVDEVYHFDVNIQAVKKEELKSWKRRKKKVLKFKKEQSQHFKYVDF
uniref:Uncharacterized protein LOC100184952 n=1 Tax=Phallusia mammillata TaxID=59560 RepID=A0A6F9DJ19_9ASCI|nr:uncharacterized protein LOC100184952 [Phallusia mammillata]